jgi:hypothetical protein
LPEVPRSSNHPWIMNSEHIKRTLWFHLYQKIESKLNKELSLKEKQVPLFWQKYKDRIYLFFIVCW